MSDPADPSLVQEYQREYGVGFHPLKLWRDRRAILADPIMAARPNPPLANSPVRFAMSLTLIPMLVIGWLLSVAVDLAYPDRERSGLYDGRAAPIVEVLEAELPGLSEQQVRALSDSVRMKDMPAAAQKLWATPNRLIDQRLRLDPSQLRSEFQAWVREVRASSLPSEQQRQLIADALDVAYFIRRGDRVFNWFLRSISEGGPLMQILGVLSLLLGAWLFRQAIQGDPRFVHAARADRFYLYYSSSRMFWFLPAQGLTYGALSYGSAAGNMSLFDSAQLVNSAIGLAAVAYVLAYSREMARALCDSETPPAGSAYAVGWRVVAALVGATIILMVASMSIGIVSALLVGFFG